jgi:septum formation protein
VAPADRRARLIFSTMRLILGSSSQFRKAVLEQEGIEFEVVSPDIDEKAIRTDNFYELPLLIAREKMKVLRDKVDGPGILIAADQIVVADGKLREKPNSKEEAFEYLSDYSLGVPAETVSAVVVCNLETGEQAEGVDIAKTYFKPIPESVMSAYIESGEAYKSAGGFAIETEPLASYVSRIEGTSDSVRGLPLALLHQLIKEVSI